MSSYRNYSTVRYQKLNLNVEGYSRVSKRLALSMEFNGTDIYYNHIHNLNTNNYNKNKASPRMILAKTELLKSDTPLQFYTKHD